MSMNLKVSKGYLGDVVIFDEPLTIKKLISILETNGLLNQVDAHIDYFVDPNTNIFRLLIAPINSEGREIIDKKIIIALSDI